MSIYTNWDPLEEVIVGNCPTSLSKKWKIPDNVRRDFDQILEETKEDLDNLSNLLDKLKVKVHRPTICEFDQNITIENFTIKNPAFPIVPRDQYWTYGNTIYQTYSSLSDRYLDSLNYNNIFTDLFNRGWNWISQPLPTLQNLDDMEGYKQWVVNGSEIYSKNYKEKLLWHTATLFRCGESILVNPRGPGTRLGLEWVQRNVDAEIIFNYKTVMNGWGHIDHGFYMIDDNTVVCDGLEFVPLCLKDKKIINIKDKLKEINYNNFFQKTHSNTNKFSQDWLREWLTEWTGYTQNLSWGTNVLVVDSNNIVFASEWPAMFEELEKHGINCHFSKQRHGWFWDAGIHCLTLDLSRKGIKRKIL
jgi:hypothetical protein